MSHVFSLTKSLLDRGHDVTLAVRTVKKGRTIDLMRKKAREYSFPKILELNLDSGFYPIDSTRDICKLSKYIDSERIQIVHCHRGQDHWTAALTLPFCKGAPKLVRTRHVTVKLRTHPFNRWLFARADQVLATGKIILDQFDRANISLRRPVRLFHGGVDCDRFHPGKISTGVRTEFGVADDDCLICAVGHLSPVKGYEYLINALSGLTEIVPRLKCLIVGSGSEEYRSHLQKLIDSSELTDHVHLTGFRSDVPEIMAESDFGVLSSIDSEGNSRTALELMASGLPVLATHVGCLPDLIVENETGFIVSPRDSDSLAEKIKLLAENETLRKSIGEKCFEFVVEHYSENKVASEMEGIYGDLLMRETT